MQNNKIYYLITIFISFIFALTTFISEAPIWCDYSPFKQLNWCQPEPPCNSNDDNSLECAKTLFSGDKYHNPANLKIDTLRDQKPSIYFRVDETMHVKFDSHHDGYIFIYNINSKGELITLFPNKYCQQLEQSYIKAGKTLIIPDIYWACDFAVSEPTGTNTLLAVLIETKMQYNLLPVNFKTVSPQHAKSLLHLLRLQLENLTMENQHGEERPIKWSAKMAEYEVKH
jgi:hypothetical protein